MRIVAYMVCEDSTEKELTDGVNELIEDGWQPFGGVCHAMVREEDDGLFYWYSQALVKYDGAT